MSMGIVNKDTAATIPAAGNTGDKVGNLAALHTTSKSDIVAAVNEVKDEQANKTDNDEVAPEFNNTTAYSTGELVYKDGQLYKFDSDHAAGAWDASEVSPTTVAAEFNQLKNTLKQETVTVTKESGDTYGTMLARLFALVDFDKIKTTSKMVMRSRVSQLVTWTSSACSFQGSIFSASDNYFEFYTITVSSSPNVSSLSISGAGHTITMTDNTSSAAPDALTIYY